jgi:hypothetical protein
MKTAKAFSILLFFALLQLAAYSQKNDTLLIKQDSIVLKSSPKDSLSKKDSSGKKIVVAKKKNSPARAALYSTVFPSLGQIYNKKYWKVPIVLAAVGIPAYTFFDNRKWYNKTRYALAVLANGSYTNADSLNKVDPKLRPGILNSDGTVNIYGLQELQNYRNYYRQNEDYSVLFFLLFYALNIVDATVDAHLKDFNVSSDLSFNIKPDIIDGSNAAGVSLVFDIHKARPKPLIAIP